MRNSTESSRSGHGRRLLFPVLFVLLSIAMVELGLQAVRLVINAGKLSNRQYLLSPYRGQNWAKPLFRETLQSRSQFDPYLGFREKPITGAYVNVDIRGLRKTWNPALPPGSNVPLVLVFGGSTVWGWGARDDNTIPSYLSKFLWGKGIHCSVSNCGQKAYIFSQEVLQLARLLREGVRPACVVSYDGFNDVFFSYRIGRADVPFEFEENKRKFEASDLELLGPGLTNWVNKHSAILGTVHKLAAWIKPDERTRYGTRAPKYTDEALRSLGKDIAEAYIRSFDLLDHLAKAYRFRYECFWQPVIFYEKELTHEEAEIGPAAGDRSLGHLFEGVRSLLKAKDLPHFHDISDALRGRQTTIYIDFAHASEAGNQLVAARLGDTLLRGGCFEQTVNHP